MLKRYYAHIRRLYNFLLVMTLAGQVKDLFKGLTSEQAIEVIAVL